jgi:gliding motility associated protien GldN
MKSKVNFLVLLGLLIGMAYTSDAQILDSPRDGVFDEINLPDKKPLSYYPVREADVVWRKRIWRIIDLRQKMNQPFYYPETRQKGMKNFMTVLMDALREGTITAYDATNDDQFLVPMTYQEIESKLTSTDTIPIYDPNNPDIILKYEVSQKDFDPSTVDRIKLKEDWFFDKQRSVMDVRILGICPVQTLNDEQTGAFIGFVNLFWIYFPEARPIFAKSIVFNRQNSAMNRTYDELFMNRLFSSYIYKDDNVYGRDISEYALGMDALLEAQRIKGEISEFENELWDY